MTNRALEERRKHLRNERRQDKKRKNKEVTD
jgi:hypothetical protein